MYSTMGSTVKYKGKQYPVKGFAPAAKVNCGLGYALLIVVDGQSKYVNTSELECKNEDKIRGFTILQNHHDIRLFSDAHNKVKSYTCLDKNKPAYTALPDFKQ